MQRADINNCSTYTVELCKAEKEIVRRRQDIHRTNYNTYLSIPRAIKKLIKEAPIDTQDGICFNCGGKFKDYKRDGK